MLQKNDLLRQDAEAEKRILAAAAERINAINSLPDPDPDEFDRVFYLSPDGDDNADGRSPQTAWKTLGRLTAAGDEMKKGDAVLLRRGGEWNSEQKTNFSGPYALKLRSGVTYSAYGEGKKPVLTNSINASGAECWEKSGYEGVWQYKELMSDNRDDIGGIVFDDGAAWGIKLIPNVTTVPFSATARTQASGMVTNGIESYISGGTLVQNPGDITGDLEFLHDYSSGHLYIRSDKNPAERFGEIRLLRRGHILRGEEDLCDCTVRNIALCYTGSHGAGLSNCHNVTFEGCYINFCGGSLQGTDGWRVRFGNGIENWGSCDGFYVRNCYLRHCYDSSITSQWTGSSDSAVLMKNIEITGNVTEDSNMVIELWNGNAKETVPPTSMEHVRITGNYGLRLGYGIGHQRPDKSGTFLTGFDFPRQSYIDCEVSGNFICHVTHYAFWVKQIAGDASSDGLILRDNTYFLDPKRTLLYRTAEDERDYLSNVIHYKYDEETLEKITARGTDRGSVFYETGMLNPDEEKGLYR